MKLIEGDLLKAKEQYICHQCNCVTLKSKGLSHYMFDRYPYANTYKRNVKRQFGTIDVNGDGKEERYVINMYSQYYPGRNKWGKNREGAFKRCLFQISQLKPESVAFPYNIGCGLAGGKWSTYKEMIEDFEEEYDIPVTIYKFE